MYRAKFFSIFLIVFLSSIAFDNRKSSKEEGK